MGIERVLSTRVSLICAGWLPAERAFESELTAGLDIERDQLWDNVIAHSDFRGSLQDACRYPSKLTWTFVCRQSDMTANDQHQPASSRAIAALATTGCFLR